MNHLTKYFSSYESIFLDFLTNRPACSSKPTPSLKITYKEYHLLLFVIQLLLLVHQVLFEVGEHFHGDVHLPRELRGLVLQVLFLLAQSLALLFGSLQL